MGRGDHLGEFEALTLAGVVRVGEQANGVAVYADMESRTGRDPGVAAVHVTLRRLQDKGLLTSRVGTPSARGGRPRRFYRATPQGLEALRAFRAMWDRVLGDLEIPGPETGR